MESIPQFALGVVKIICDKPKIVLVQDGTIIEQIGKNFNKVLV